MRALARDSQSTNGIDRAVCERRTAHRYLSKNSFKLSALCVSVLLSIVALRCAATMLYKCNVGAGGVTKRNARQEVVVLEIYFLYIGKA